MQRLRTRSQSKLLEKQTLPVLRTSGSFITKNILTLSKVDLDSRMMKQHRKLSLLNNQIDNSQIRQSQNIRIKTKLLLDGSTIKRNKSQRERQQGRAYKKIDSSHQESQLIQSNTVNPNVVIDPSKISSKNYGFIRGYAANSHVGLYNSVNEDRICIVTNLNKTSFKNRQISFFGIFDGNQGTFKADYYRDNFHVIIQNQQNIWQDPQSAIKNAIQKIQKNISTNLLYQQDDSTVGYVVLLTLGENAYLIVAGQCRAVISKEFAQHVEGISRNKTKLISRIQYQKKLFSRKQEAISVAIKHVPLNLGLDFIFLGSEGIFQNYNEQEVSKKLWIFLMKNKIENIHLGLGEANNHLLNLVFSLPSTKNASSIFVGFKNIQQCFNSSKNEILQLPYLQKVLDLQQS